MAKTLDLNSFRIIMPVHIRKAIESDCIRLMELIQQLAVFEKEPNAIRVSLEHFTACGFGSSPCWEAFVAIDQNQIVGFALFYTRYSTWRGKRLYLEDLYVTEPFRNQQVGKQLFEKLQQHALDQGYTGMNWQVLEWNADAIRFYKKFDEIHLEDGWLNGYWK
ncbi:MAG TPA: GNAT family N-acetyltransferase [Ferruginibacter sp.]|nr:GNAT family N-acetyltransferase [Ferruginibacter sp.]HRO16645.1 GNAT family N-acetyltransferase [Ferruginibacter sp.]HRQ21222.1 GNAT family N-acetyltransferase [Ferruginibacter sp.]